MATASKAALPYEHIQVLMIRATQMLENENFPEALGFLLKATDEVMQLEAINKQVGMTVGGGRPYRIPEDKRS
jgi:hypothetical protein